MPYTLSHGEERDSALDAVDLPGPEDTAELAEVPDGTVDYPTAEDGDEG